MRFWPHFINLKGHVMIIGAPISNGVANQILFADANILLAVDSDLVFDQATGHVGIGGVASPVANLEVVTDIRSNWLNGETDYLRVSAGSNQGVAIWENAGTGEVFIGNEFNDDTGDIHFCTKVSVDDNNIKMTVQGNGNISVGVATAEEILDINGALTIIDGMTAPGTHSGKASIYVDTADGDLKVKFGDGTVKTLATDT